MIRRDLPADGRAPARWALIPQIEHARLAGRLAEHWGGGGFDPLRPRDEVLWAIDHHDDGWRDWDRAPGVNPASGQPRAFTEMEIDDSLAIWSASIDCAARTGPLQGYLVAGHFCALSRRAITWNKSDPAWPRAEAFIANYESRMQTWLAAWGRQNPQSNTAAVAQLALAHLQFFDLLSLWFCCAEATGTDEVPTPAGGQLTLASDTPQLLRVSPWPLDVERLNLEVPARVVPVAHYGSREELAIAPAESIILRWELNPGPADKS